MRRRRIGWLFKGWGHTGGEPGCTAPASAGGWADQAPSRRTRPAAEPHARERALGGRAKQRRGWADNQTGRDGRSKIAECGGKSAEKKNDAFRVQGAMAAGVSACAAREAWEAQPGRAGQAAVWLAGRQGCARVCVVWCRERSNSGGRGDKGPDAADGWLVVQEREGAGTLRTLRWARAPCCGRGVGRRVRKEEASGRVNRGFNKPRSLGKQGSSGVCGCCCCGGGRPRPAAECGSEIKGRGGEENSWGPAGAGL